MAEVREIPPEQLKEILDAHREWVTSQGKEGHHADLSEANLQLAELQGAFLQGANLQGTDLRGADLNRANLESVNFQTANLHGANLKGASLISANLQQANMLNTKLRESFLQDANLTGVKRLLAEQLAGAHLAGATLPQDIHKFEALTTINEASKNTKRIFLAMLLACAYSALTVFSTTDARLLTNSASSPLPIIGTAIPIAGFFGVAPGILFAIFIYFHLYLQRLWEGLAELPAIFPDGRPLDKCAYPWLLNGLVRSHFAILRRERPPLSHFQALISIVLAWWTVPFTISLFWLRYLPRHDWVGTGFHLGFLVLAVLCAVWFQRLAKRTLLGQQPALIVFKGNWRSVKTYWEVVKRAWKLIGTGLIVILLAFVISDGAINGQRQKSYMPNMPNCWFFPNVSRTFASPTDFRVFVPQLLPCVGARAFSDLAEQDVSTRPPNWFRDGELPRLVRGAQLRGANLQYAHARKGFLVNADLRGANLQKADLRGANLQKADLRGANLQGASLNGANLQGAELDHVNLQEAFLAEANFQGADLLSTNLQGASLNGANLHGARLEWSNLQGADLRPNLYLKKTTGLTASEVMKARNWELAFYDNDLIRVLGLKSDHNERLKEKLAKLEKEQKEAATEK